MAIINKYSKSSLEKKKSEKIYIYSDLNFSLEKQNIDLGGGGLFFSGKGKDIKVDYDAIAISNSIRNIFNTVPGQNPLAPTFGLNLNRFLFEEISINSAEILGRKIEEGIKRWESRVDVEKIAISIDIDNHLYNISLYLIPRNVSDTRLTIQGNLSESGFN